MDFIALIIAGIAIGIALKARSRIALLEHNFGLVAKRHEGGAAAETPPAAREEKPASRSMYGHRPRRRSPRHPRSRRRRGRTNPTSRRSSRKPHSHPPRPQNRPHPAKSFEERFGTSWVVWIGGLALALGGIFLVQSLSKPA